VIRDGHRAHGFSLKVSMKTTSFSNFCRGFAAALLLGMAPWSAQALFPVYFNVDFEGETIGQEPSLNAIGPLPTSTQFTGLSVTSPAYISVTNNLWGNPTRFAYFDSVGGNAATMVAQIQDISQPTNGTLRIAMDLAASSLVTTTAWMPLGFSDATIMFNFLDNGKFRVETANSTNDIGEYHPGQFTNIEFQIDLDSRTFNVLTMQGSYTNLLLAGIPTGGDPGSKFQSIVPGPVNLNTDYQFGIDNVVIQMIPEPNSACLSLVGGALLAAIVRRRRSH
jgi:hypothetical protein